MTSQLASLLVVLTLSVPSAAWAQRGDDDAPLPYDDDDNGQAVKQKVKKQKKARDEVREEDEEDKSRSETLAHLDDPNLGLSFEALAGAMLIQSSRGGLVDPRFGWGFRFTWEFGRLIPDEFLREMFFADVTWQYAVTADGTTQVNADAHNHYFSVAPAVALPFGKAPVAAYAQIGVGLNYTASALHVAQAETDIGGVKFLFQYGVGLRFRPALTADGSVRLSFRIEATRLMRGYMTDTLVGGSIGVTF